MEAITYPTAKPPLADEQKADQRVTGPDTPAPMLSHLTKISLWPGSRVPAWQAVVGGDGMGDHLFDVYIVVDWSARSTPSPARPCPDALWIGEWDRLAHTQRETYWRTRNSCITYLLSTLHRHTTEHKRVSLEYPAGLYNATSPPASCRSRFPPCSTNCRAGYGGVCSRAFTTTYECQQG